MEKNTDKCDEDNAETWCFLTALLQKIIPNWDITLVSGRRKFFVGVLFSVFLNKNLNYLFWLRLFKILDGHD